VNILEARKLPELPGRVSHCTMGTAAIGADVEVRIGDRGRAAMDPTCRSRMKQISLN